MSTWDLVSVHIYSIMCVVLTAKVAAQFEPECTMINHFLHSDEDFCSCADA